MVKHPNGLSSVYGHLSVIKAVEGQNVATGDVIGYSGNTGYSTGPHLHLGIYASQGVRIENHVNSRACKSAKMPIADIMAYLDPFEYLPEL
jgi:murein DD-endopeptidase MepM/ murein hydrolase activator NlpD